MQNCQVFRVWVAKPFRSWIVQNGEQIFDAPRKTSGNRAKFSLLQNSVSSRKASAALQSAPRPAVAWSYSGCSSPPKSQSSMAVSGSTWLTGSAASAMTESLERLLAAV